MSIPSIIRTLAWIGLGLCILVTTMLASLPLSWYYSDVVFQRMQGDPDYYPGYEGWEAGIIYLNIVGVLILYGVPGSVLLTGGIWAVLKARHVPCHIGKTFVGAVVGVCIANIGLFHFVYCVWS
jgi:hypothetical protein